MCLSGTVVWILAQDDDLDLVDGGLLECVEYQSPRWVAGVGAVFLPYKMNESEKVVLLKLIL